MVSGVVGLAKSSIKVEGVRLVVIQIKTVVNQGWSNGERSDLSRIVHDATRLDANVNLTVIHDTLRFIIIDAPAHSVFGEAFGSSGTPHETSVAIGSFRNILS